jgi:hypothetical protein
MPTANKLNRTNANALLLAGTQKHFTSNTAMTFGGGSHLPSEIVTALQSRSAASTATTAAETAFHAAVKAEANTRTQTALLIRQFIAFVLATFGEDTTILADFGLTPRKPAVISPATRVAAAAKAKATRTARGTKGKVQAKAITASPATPAAEPAPAAPTAAPTPATPAVTKS